MDHKENRERKVHLGLKGHQELLVQLESQVKLANMDKRVKLDHGYVRTSTCSYT